MIGRILNLLVTVVICLCVATVLAGGILAAYYANAWGMTPERMDLVLAVARGTDLETLLEGKLPPKEVPKPEPVSYNQLADARSLSARNLELREQALRGALQQLQMEQRRVADEKKRLMQLREGFETDLLAMKKGATATGREDVRRTLETIKPKQAKELLVQMLDRKEIDDVVLLIEGMPETKRAKILAEFKTPLEVESIGEVLRRIRLGQPETAVAGEAQKRLEPPKGSGS